MGSRLRACLPLLAAVAALSPRAAAAQDLQVVIENIDGREEDEFMAQALTNVPINAVECEQGRGIDLEVNNIPTSASVLDFWSSTGPNCNEAMPRSDETVAGCEHLFDFSTNGNRTVGDSSAGSGDPLKIEARRFVPPSRDEPCGDVDETLVIYVLAANSAMSTAEVGSSWGSIEIAYDTRAPSTPGAPEGIGGESRVGIKWDLSEQDLLEHRIYVDQSGGACGGGGDAGGMDAAMDAAIADAGGDAGDAAMPDGATDAAMDSGTDAGPMTTDAGPSDGGLVPDGGFPREMVPGSCEPIPGGQTVGDEFELVRCVEGTSDSGALSQSQLDSLGIGLGDTVAIAVTAIDQARNESEPAIACVTRVNTTGFCESFDEAEGCPDGCGCTAPGGAGPASTGAGLAFGALLVACTGLWLARRRRHAPKRRNG